MQNVESTKPQAAAGSLPHPSSANAADRAPSRARKLAPLLIVILAALALAGGGYYAWKTWFAGDDAAGDVVTAVVVRGNLEDTVTATGTLQPKEFVDVGTQVSGQVKRLLVDVGATVTARQLLAEIDPSVYQSKVDGDRAQLQNQRAQLADRQAQLALAELQLTRQQNMAREEATTAEALQSAEAARKSAMAQVDSVKAQTQQTESVLRGDEANLGYTKIYAPITGTVVSQAVKQGQTLNANQQAPVVMRIANLSTMTVQAQVSEADVSKLHIGMDVYFTTLGGNNRRFYGKLRQIPPTPTVVNNVVLYDALFDVENPNQALMTQMTAQVFFVVSSARDAVLVPLTALRPVASDASGGRQGRAGGRRGKDSADKAAPEGSAKADPAAAPPAADATRPAADGSAKSANGGAGGGRAPRAAGTERERTGERAGGDVRSRFANGRALVSVVDENGDIKDREVQVGVTNRISAQILSGLEPGEKVVVGTRAPAAAKAAATSSLVPAAPKGGGGGGGGGFRR